MDEPTEPSGLEFFTADEMVAELGKRYRAVVLAYTGELKGSESKDEHNWLYRGGFIEAVGLLTATKHRLLALPQDNGEEDEDDE